MTTLSYELAQAKIADSHRQAEHVRAGRRITAERHRARRARKAAERTAHAFR